MFKISMNVEEKTTINYDYEELKNYLTDFRNWKQWSPWLIQDKNCEVTITGEAHTVGHKNHWKSPILGEGEIFLTDISNLQLSYQLNNFKPWKSSSKVYFKFNKKDEGVEVSWTMEGSMPFFMFPMKKLFCALIANDFRRGLLMLKDQLESGEVLSQVDIKENSTSKGFYYLGKRTTCNLDDINEAMTKDFKGLMGFIEKKGLKPTQALSFYHDYNMVKGTCDYTAAFSFEEKPQIQNSHLETGEIPGHKFIRVDHTGTYKHLGNAWCTIMNFQMSSKQKLNKKISGHEIYHHMPGEVPEKDILTELRLPIK